MDDNSLRCVTWSIVEAEQAGLDELAYRRFIQLSDDLTNDAEVRELITAGIETTGTRWDDAVAALVEHHFINLGLPVPGWAVERGANPVELWEPQRSTQPLPFSVDFDEVALPFLRRGVLIEENELGGV